VDGPREARALGEESGAPPGAEGAGRCAHGGASALAFEGVSFMGLAAVRVVEERLCGAAGRTVRRKDTRLGVGRSHIGL